MEPASPLVNRVLTFVGKVEVALLKRMSLPFGTSDDRDCGEALARSPGLLAYQSRASKPARSLAVCEPRTRMRRSSKISSSECCVPCSIVSPPQ